MEKIFDFIVRRRNRILIIMIVLAAVCACLIPFVHVNTDMTAYLPLSSPMKQGIDIMKEEFNGLSMDSTIRVMFTGLPEEEKNAVRETLEGYEYVSSVDFSADSEEYNVDGRTLYIIHSSYDYYSPEMESIISRLEEEYTGYCGMVYHKDSSVTDAIPPEIMAMALVIIVTILIIMSPSVVEPVLFLIAIGMAVAINMGSNYFLGGVSQTTHAIGALLQLVLSLDYSVMVMEQYRQSKKDARDNAQAMSKGLMLSLRPVLGSSVTTMAGLLMLVFMSFRIGADLGIVLAKGVLTSLICVFTVMPALVLAFDGWIQKTEKRVPRFPSGRMGSFSFRFGRGILVLFVILMAAVFYFKGNTEITYTMPVPTVIDDYFPKVNSVVLLYSNQDEERIPDIVELAENTKGTRSVTTYANTLGKSYTAGELNDMLASYGMEEAFLSFTADMPLKMSSEDAISMLMNLYNENSGRKKGSPVTIMELLDYIGGDLSRHPLYGLFITEEVKQMIGDFAKQLEEAKAALKGEKHSLMVVQTILPDESGETMQFMKNLEESCTEKLTGDWYLIGSSPMAYEMSKSFRGELNRISIYTAVAVLLVVLFTFRKVLLSVLLVSLIQTAVYITVVVMGLQGQSMYYLAFLMVQSILMGASIDYAIVFTNYYRVERRNSQILDSVRLAYRNSSRTILTSGLIIVVATIILGYAFEDPSIGQICHTIAKGTISALILILFVLPGMLCALDRLVIEKH